MILINMSIKNIILDGMTFLCSFPIMTINLRDINVPSEKSIVIKKYSSFNYAVLINSYFVDKDNLHKLLNHSTIIGIVQEEDLQRGLSLGFIQKIENNYYFLNQENDPRKNIFKKI